MISIGNHGWFIDNMARSLKHVDVYLEYDHTTGGQNDPSGAPGEGFHPTWGDYAFVLHHHMIDMLCRNVLCTGMTPMASVPCQFTTASTCLTTDSQCSGWSIDSCHLTINYI